MSLVLSSMEAQPFLNASRRNDDNSTNSSGLFHSGLHMPKISKYYSNEGGSFIEMDEAHPLGL